MSKLYEKFQASKAAKADLGSLKETVSDGVKHDLNDFGMAYDAYGKSLNGNPKAQKKAIKIFAMALKNAGMHEDVFKDPENSGITAFIPTDAAMAKLSDDQLKRLDDPITAATFVAAHIVPDKIDPAELVDGEIDYTLLRPGHTLRMEPASQKIPKGISSYVPKDVVVSSKGTKDNAAAAVKDVLKYGKATIYTISEPLFK